MARMSDKEFIVRDLLKRLKQEKNRLLRQKERVDGALSDTNKAFKNATSQLADLLKPKKKPAKKKSQKPKIEKEAEEKMSALDVMSEAVKDVVAEAKTEEKAATETIDKINVDESSS